ncbi:MAG: hypothetical protein HYY45_11425 [Deltaproteobacteria bacterium]|nr:hypothetical protein [Deltaproteobacteria bacterium]
MKGKKASKKRSGEGREGNVVRRLKRMLEDSKTLCREDDPVLQGQMQVILGMLADILEAKDPARSFHHVVEYE